MAASASAEFFADILLCPMEAVKVRIQTMPGYASTLREALPKMIAQEGISGFYKGIVPLWGRQIPYTMMKFSCFERTLEALYEYVVPKPRDQCSKGEQLVVTFTAGYIAGVFCAIISHPADTIVSKLNQNPNARLGEVASNLGLLGILYIIASFNILRTILIIIYVISTIFNYLITLHFSCFGVDLKCNQK